METIATTDQVPCGRASERSFKKWFSAITLGVCLVSILLIWQSTGWGTVYLLMGAFPVVNLVLMLIGVISAWNIRRRHPESKLGVMLALALCLPPLGYLIMAIASSMMPSRGGGC